MCGQGAGVCEGGRVRGGWKELCVLSVHILGLYGSGEGSGEVIILGLHGSGEGAGEVIILGLHG